MKAQDFYLITWWFIYSFQGMEAFDYKLDFAYNKNKPNQLVLTVN
jgi:hypothetical protein